MSGGHYQYDLPYGLNDEWEDEEMNDMYADLFGYGWYDTRERPLGRPRKCREVEFGPRGGGLFQSLDFWRSGDTSEEDYLEDLRKFKEKWFRKTPKNRVEYYRNRFREYCDEIRDQFVQELGLGDVDE